MRRAIACVGAAVMLAGSAAWARPQADAGRDRTVVEQTIRDSICWAVAGAKTSTWLPLLAHQSGLDQELTELLQPWFQVAHGGAGANARLRPGWAAGAILRVDSAAPAGDTRVTRSCRRFSPRRQCASSGPSARVWACGQRP